MVIAISIYQIQIYEKVICNKKKSCPDSGIRLSFTYQMNGIRTIGKYLPPVKCLNWIKESSEETSFK